MDFLENCVCVCFRVCVACVCHCFAYRRRNTQVWSTLWFLGAVAVTMPSLLTLPNESYRSSCAVLWQLIGLFYNNFISISDYHVVPWSEAEFWAAVPSLLASKVSISRTLTRQNTSKRFCTQGLKTSIVHMLCFWKEAPQNTASKPPLFWSDPGVEACYQRDSTEQKETHNHQESCKHAKVCVMKSTCCCILHTCCSQQMMPTKHH